VAILVNYRIDVECFSTSVCIDSCSFTVTINDNEKPTITCPTDYEIAADGVNKGVRYDLTQDLPKAIANDNCAIQSKTITNPTEFAPAQLNIGDNQITMKVVDVNGNQATCNYNIKVVPIGACCGALPSGCIDVIRADCPDEGFWVANTKCSEDCGMKKIHVINQSQVN
jgi:hypothetical protein